MNSHLKKQVQALYFENKIVGGSIPREFIAPIQAGIEESMKNGVIAGFPLVDIKASCR